MTKEQLIEHDEQLVDTLTAISVISKQLAKKLKRTNNMSKMKQLNDLLNEMKESAKYQLRIIEEFQELLSEENTSSSHEKVMEESRHVTLEELRGVLATKASEGFKDEIRALLKAYGADSLSKLDPKNYSALMEEAGGIGID